MWDGARHRAIAGWLLGLGLVVCAVIANREAFAVPDGPVPSAPARTQSCSKRENLVPPSIGFLQGPDRLELTLENGNSCYGYLEEAVEIAYYSEQRRIASYRVTTRGVGVCCTVTLPPHGQWTITLPSVDDGGCIAARMCELRVTPVLGDPIDAWRRMPDGNFDTVLGTLHSLPKGDGPRNAR